MNTNIFKQPSGLAVILMTFIHHFLFWNELLGLNAFIFAIVVSLTLYFQQPTAFKNKMVQLSFIGFFLCSCFVLYHGSDFAKVNYIWSFTVFVGMVHAESLKTSFLSFMSFFESVFHLKELFSKIEMPQNTFKTLKLLVIPVFLLSVFSVIFIFANPKFEAIIDYLVVNFVENLLFFSVERFIFLCFGFGISLVLFNKAKTYACTKLEGFDQIIRNKSKQENPLNFAILDLKTEYLTAVITFTLINLLLLIVNVIDIEWIWFNFEVEKAGNLSQLVHEGTYLLILSILLSMGILEYFFRKNLNFYPNNDWMKNLAYVWIFQNVILVISVALRNYHYIAEHGLAYKRIGVVFFLIATIIGLLSQFIKIKKSFSTYFLLRMNSWSVYSIVICMSFFNWDSIIAHHNIHHHQPEKIDYHFLFQLSDKTLPIIKENEELLKDSMNFKTSDYHSNLQIINAREILRYRTLKFTTEYQKRGWLSWNYADSKAFYELESLNK